MKDEIVLLKQAVFEINSLKRQNELMMARLDMFDSINAILHTEVARRGGYESPDLVFEIEKFIKQNESQDSKSA